MKEKLVIVESPSKAKTIGSYLGSEYEVVSSVGHLRDLATSGPGGLGLDVEDNFKPNYVVIRGKNKVVTEIKKAAKNREVLIATDPDREGEAIAWHIADLLELDVEDKNRIIFTEITKPAILGAIDNVRPIDMDLVKSQEVRRAVDRIIGFKLSNLLRNKIKSKSAGRVQSVALKLIVDLEKEIQAFIPEEYYEIEATFPEFKADYKIVGKRRIKKEEADKIVETSTNPFEITNIEVKDSKRAPKLPFITSTLQQDANIYLSMSGARTMSIAQSLYEGVEINGELTGLITYMRTDSTRLSDVFVKEANALILEKFGEEYLGTYRFTKKEGSQDAHEAIRPTSLENTPKKLEQYLDSSQHRLYERIYNRALASLMSSAIFERTKVGITSNDNLYEVSGVREVFKGFLEVYDEQQTKDIILPKLEMGQKLTASLVEAIRKETQPKARYNEAGLIKDMEALGIGRPSTYAQVMQTLKSKDRNYLTVENRRFIPTEKGILTVDQLELFFNDIINVNYTSQMEDNLDLVSEGKKDNIELLRNFYNRFIPMVEDAQKNMKKIEAPKLDELCPECGHQLVIRDSYRGEFVACSNFPKCKFTRSLEDKDQDNIISHNEEEEENIE